VCDVSPVFADAALSHANLPSSRRLSFPSLLHSAPSALVFLHLFWLSFVTYFQHHSAHVQHALTSDVARVYSVLRRLVEE
jgi:hypothetical protein